MRADGLSESEGAVMDSLTYAVTMYLDLPVDHPNEPEEFVNAIHRCQDLMAIRVVRRDHPEGWPVYDA